MATYRSVYITFWSDTKVCDDFTPEDKYFMLYCLTNKFTNLCGCYEISKKQMALDLGYNIETIDKLLKRFTNVHKTLFYDDTNKELFIKNWNKYNWTSSSKLDKPLLEEIKKIKNQEFKSQLVSLYNERDTVSIPYTYHIDTEQIPYRYNCTVSVNDNDISFYRDVNNNNIKKIAKCFEDNIGFFTPASSEKILSYLDDLPSDMICEAIKRSALANKKSTNYIIAILNNWIRKGFKVLTDIEEDDLKRANSLPNSSKNMTEEEKDEWMTKVLLEAEEEVKRNGYVRF